MNVIHRGRDVAFLLILCGAMVAPWIATSLNSKIVPPQPVIVERPLFPVTPKLPANDLERVVFRMARRAMNEAIFIRDSSTPPAVYSPELIRIEPVAENVWQVYGVFTAPWEMLMARPHLYEAKVVRICHLADDACFRVRELHVDTESIAVMP